MKKIIFLAFVTLISALLLQGFQCATKEMMTAKTAYKNKELDRAIEYLQKELGGKNPDNEEALIMMIKIRLEQKMYQEAANIMVDAAKKMKNPKYKDQLPALRNKLWVDSYNEGLAYHKKYMVDYDTSFLDSAVYLFDVGITIRPNILEFHHYKGLFLEMKGDTISAIEALKKYVDIVKPAIDFAQEKGIYSSLSPEEVSLILGTTNIISVDTLGSEGQILRRIDAFTSPKSEESLLYYENKSGSGFKLTGWNLGLPQDWLEGEKGRFTPISMEPYSIIAQYYFDRKEFEQSLIFLKDMQKFNPQDINTNGSIVQIYTELDKEDVALKELDDLTKSQPDNKLYWSLYGDMLNNMKKYDEAIAKYEKALTIDPNYDFALRNIASAYKNKAGIIQEEEKDKKIEDKNYKTNTKKYFPLLEKAGGYFSSALSTDEFKNNPIILTELANIYQVTGKTKELTQILKKITEVEYLVSKEEREQLYLDLIRIYSTKKDNKKTAEYTRKYESLVK
jgi:tetratricopeptide (TPR) repeat protein